MAKSEDEMKIEQGEEGGGIIVSAGEDPTEEYQRGADYYKRGQRDGRILD